MEMDIATYKPIFESHLLTGLALGMGVWFLTWGLNRVYLFVKSAVNF